MKKGKDIAVEFPGLYLIHQNLPEKHVSAHSHAEHLLFMPLQGEITLIIDQRRYVIGPGKMLYLPANTEHAFESSKQLGERVIALLSPQAWKKQKAGKFSVTALITNQLCKEIFFYLLLHPQVKHAESLVSVLITTLEEALQNGYTLNYSLDHLESRIKDKRIEKAIEYIKLNFSETLRMEEVARKTGLSLRNFNRLFLTELGRTPKQFLTQVRIENAKRLLQEEKRSVTEVAFGSGYQSLSQFISIFRQSTGQLPSAFRRN